MKIRSCSVIAAIALVSIATPVISFAQSRDLPVLLVHGFCSDSRTWSDMISRLQPSTRYGNGVTHLYTASGIVFHRGDGDDPGAWDTRVPSRIDFQTPPYTDKRLFTIDFYSDQAATFDSDFVNDTGVAHKAAELSAVIREVTRINGSTKVIVVGHSLGGLAARSYVQGFASLNDVDFLPYVHNVAQIITIDTPHNGANGFANINPTIFPHCTTETSRDKGDLAAGSEFLNTLNNVNDTLNNPAIPAALKFLYKPAIPDSVKTTAIYSWNDTLIQDPEDGDGVVPRDSQRLTTRSPYTSPGYGYVTDHPHPITDYYGPPPELAKLHVGPDPIRWTV